MCLTKNIKKFVVGVGIFRIDGIPAFGSNTIIDSVEFSHDKMSGSIEFEMKKLGLIEGEYYFDIAIEGEDATPFDYYREAKRMQVYSQINDIGLIRVEHSWILDNKLLKKIYI